MFNEIPNNIKVPLTYIEFDNSRAVQGTPAIPYKLLVMGQRLAVGTVAADVPILVTSEAQAEKYFGRGSMLSAMIKALKKANRFVELWAIASDDNAGGVLAAGTVTPTGAATAAGTIQLYIAGKKISVAVAVGDDGDAIAINMAAAINAVTDLPVTAAVDGITLNEVDVTARHKGEVGNDIDMRVNYQIGEELPAGITCPVVAMSAGTTNPDISTAIAAMGDEWYNVMVCPYTDATNLTALETEMTTRWGPTKQIDGQVFTAFRGSVGVTQTFGDGRNSQHVSCMGTGISPTPPYIWAAVNAGVAAMSLSIDPARPLQTLFMPGVLPPAITDRWTFEERNLLLGDGVATSIVDAGGRVLIERQVTMYQENAFGVPDPSYLDVNTGATLSYLRYSTRARISLKFPRHKLASDGTRFGPGQKVVTPSVIRGELIALFREWETAGLVENFEQFKEDLVVERDGNDANRVNVLAPPDLMNQFRVFAAQLQFIV